MKEKLTKARENWLPVLGSIAIASIGVIIFTAFIGLFQLETGPDAGWPPLWVYGTAPAFGLFCTIGVIAGIAAIWDEDF